MEEGARIEYSRKFLKQAAKLPLRVIDETQDKELIFKTNFFDPRLRTHKLHGKEKELWAFWINHSYRIKFAFLKTGGVLFLEIGTHKIYK
jgi:plasmid maintenance system killer protein